MDDGFCTDCKTITHVVFDHATGDIICTECALVLESHSVDDTPEWRTFADDSNDKADPMRVGKTSTTSILLGKSDLSTHVVSLPNGTKPDSLPGSLALKLNRGPNPDKSLTSSFDTIADMADRLGLIPPIKFRASEIYKKVQDQKPIRGRNHNALLAACLYIACQQENKPRSVKEICTVANGNTMKEFHRAKKCVAKQLEDEMGHVSDFGTAHAGDYLRRFCSSLGMNNQSVKAAQETVQTIDKMDIRRNPTSIAAAVIYILARLSKEKNQVLLRDVSIATGVAEGTIRNAYKDLCPHVSTIIPTWFAKMVDLGNL